MEIGDYIEDVFFSDSRFVKSKEDWESMQAFRSGGKRQGLDLDAGRKQSGYIEEAGFVDVR